MNDGLTADYLFSALNRFQLQSITSPAAPSAPEDTPNASSSGLVPSTAALANPSATHSTSPGPASSDEQSISPLPVAPTAPTANEPVTPTVAATEEPTTPAVSVTEDPIARAAAAISRPGTARGRARVALGNLRREWNMMPVPSDCSVVPTSVI
ncbi:hypothetical protein QFC24_005854 [Naganishia onofrii]|uniref:Uncharacterized protein n=1 Tax=Naganishia onofrii TaxID=1851511 RepID=A0ACC2X657_9TREE|nr:hypothetical protein QFC24_005854 [Naganishia onofrii]